VTEAELQQDLQRFAQELSARLVDAGTPLLDPARGFIDASPFYDEASGRWYLYVMEENLRPPKIWVARLAPNLKSLDTSLTECLTASQPWEGGWIEGPVALRHGASYYLFYSGNGYGSPNYSVGYATAPGPTGPWTKYAGNPILRKAGEVSGPGHNGLAASPDGKELFIVYHRHIPPRPTEGEWWQRQLAIDRLRFVADGAGPDRLIVEGPTTTSQPLPSGARPFPVGKSDPLDETLDRSRWHTFGEQPEQWFMTSDTLRIATVDGDLFGNRTDASNIFLQYAPAGDFTVVNPLDDPLDMLLPEERRPLHEPPVHVMPEQLHPKIYYVGRGTVAGLMRLPNGTVVRT
jgi:hypothetical protein